MSTQHPPSKESHFYDWEAERSEERPSAFSRETGYSSLGARVVRGRRSLGPGVLLLAGALLVGFGIIVVTAMKDWLST
jgi:hypothetical protein